MSTLMLLFLALFVLSFIPIGWVALRAYRKLRGTRVVSCPETGCGAAVEFDRAHAAMTYVMGETKYRLVSCTQWPEKEGCAQGCVSQIEKSPDGCLVENMLVDWYRGADCVICRTEIPEIRSSDAKPALMTPVGLMMEWNEVRPEDLPQVLKTHRPVCWSCHSKSFRAQFPDLAVGRQAENRAS